LPSKKKYTAHTVQSSQNDSSFEQSDNTSMDNMFSTDADTTNTTSNNDIPIPKIEEVD